MAGLHQCSRLEVPVVGTRALLSSLADVHADGGRTQINREQGGRFLALKCNIQGRDMGSFVDEAQARVSKDVKLPEGYYMTWGGEFENQRRTMKRLMILVPISILVICSLLYFTFRSALSALVVLLDVPFATVHCDDILSLAVKNTNLKAHSLLFGPSANTLAEMNAALSRVVDKHSERSDAKRVMVLAFGEQTAVLRIQTLLAPHIAEESDAKMDQMEASMAKEEEHHVLFSAGRGFAGPNLFQGYIAYQATLGPHE